MEKPKQPNPLYQRVADIFEEVLPVDQQTVPSPVASLIDLAEGKTVTGMKVHATQEKRQALAFAIEEMRKYAAAQKPDYDSKKRDSRTYRFIDISVEDDYVSPHDPTQTPMLRIQLFTTNVWLRGRYGMTVAISFATDGEKYILETGSHHKNEGPGQASVRSGSITNLRSKTYEIVRPIINGYRQVAAMDRTVNGGAEIIPGHHFNFPPLP